MSELKHWLDESSEADEFERSVLRAGFEADPAEAKRDQIWATLMGTLAVAPLAATTATAAATSQALSAKTAIAGVSKAAAVWLGVGKGFVVGLAIYGAAAGVSEISERLSAPRPTPVATQRAVMPVQAKNPAEPASAASSLPLSAALSGALSVPREEAPSKPRATERGNTGTSTNPNAVAREGLNAGAEPPAVAIFDDPEAPSGARVSQLDAETRALRRARAELRAGKLADAFATLEASRRQFSAPELYQEREALTIELLYRSGQVAAAGQRAKGFMSRFPESPHVQHLREFIDPTVAR